MLRQNLVEQLKNGKVGIMPTDTIYGIVGSALRPATVRRIYRLRRRNPKKPMIILIGAVDDLAQFGVFLPSSRSASGRRVKKVLNRVWPGKVSVILPISPRRISRARGASDPSAETFLTKFSYLHRGTGTLAFRLPRPRWLRSLLCETGPLVAPSANFEGEPSARTVGEARKYFAEKVDFYRDGGNLDSAPSTIIKINNGKSMILRGNKTQSVLKF
jgi:L-threonylcarbamoyladenylate synthase